MTIISFDIYQLFHHSTNMNKLPFTVTDQSFLPGIWYQLQRIELVQPQFFAAVHRSNWIPVQKIVQSND